MRILDLYVLRRHVGPFFFALGTITFLFVMRVLVDYVNLFATRHLDLWTVIQIFILSLGWIFALTFPMSVLVAVVMAFGRLSQDAELDAIHAAGVSFRRTLRPVLIGAIVLTGGLVLYNDVVLPEANHRLKDLTADIHKMRPTIAIREGVFMDDFEGYTLLVREVDHDRNIVHDVTAYAMDPKEPVRTIHAPWGELLWENDGDRLVIRLHDGEMHEVDPDSPESYFLLHFDIHNLVFDALGTRLSHSGETSRGDREMSIEAMQALVNRLHGERGAEADSLRKAAVSATADLRTSVRMMAAGSAATIRPADFSSQVRMLLRKLRGSQHRMESEQLDINRFEVEIHKKWAFPVACLVFVLIGAPLGARVRRGSLGVGGGLAFGFFLIYYMASLGGEKLGDRGYVPPAIGMWAMDIALAVVGIYLVGRRDGFFGGRRARS